MIPYLSRNNLIYKLFLVVFKVSVSSRGKNLNMLLILNILLLLSWWTVYKIWNRAPFLSLINSTVEKGIDEIFCSCPKRLGRLGNCQLPVKNELAFHRQDETQKNWELDSLCRKLRKKLEISRQTSTSSLFSSIYSCKYALLTLKRLVQRLLSGIMTAYSTSCQFQETIEWKVKDLEMRKMWNWEFRNVVQDVCKTAWKHGMTRDTFCIFFSSLQTFFSLKLNGHNPIMFRSCCKTNKKHLMSLWVCMLKLSKAGVISFKKLYCFWGWEKKWNSGVYLERFALNHSFTHFFGSVSHD